MSSHLYPLHYNFSCFYSICIFSYDKFCSIIKCPQELLYCFKPSRHLSLFHNLLLPSGLCCLLYCLLQSLLVVFVFLHCGSSLVHTDKLHFSPSLCLLFSFITFVVCFIQQFSGWNIENQSASLQRNQITLPTSDGPLLVPQTAFLEIPWVFLHCPADYNKIICQMRFKFFVFSKDWTVCEGLAYKAIQPWINEQKLKAATVLWWELLRVVGACLSHSPCPELGNNSWWEYWLREYLVLRGVKAVCAQGGGGSAAVCLDLYGKEQAQPRQTIANMLWRNIASLN